MHTIKSKIESIWKILQTQNVRIMYCINHSHTLTAPSSFTIIQFCKFYGEKKKKLHQFSDKQSHYIYFKFVYLINNNNCGANLFNIKNITK